MNGRDGHVKCIDTRLGRKSAACDKSLCQGRCFCCGIQQGNVIECRQSPIRRFGIALRGFVWLGISWRRLAASRRCLPNQRIWVSSIELCLTVGIRHTWRCCTSIMWPRVRWNMAWTCARLCEIWLNAGSSFS